MASDYKRIFFSSLLLEKFHIKCLNEKKLLSEKDSYFKLNSSLYYKGYQAFLRKGLKWRLKILLFLLRFCMHGSRTVFHSGSGWTSSRIRILYSMLTRRWEEFSIILHLQILSSHFIISSLGIKLWRLGDNRFLPLCDSSNFYGFLFFERKYSWWVENFFQTSFCQATCSISSVKIHR